MSEALKELYDELFGELYEKEKQEAINLAVAEKNATIAEQTALIAELKAQLAAAKA